MLERRPLWGLIVLLNVCVVIWRMQEPAMLNVEYVDGFIENGNANTNTQQQEADVRATQTHYSNHQQKQSQQRLPKHLPHTQLTEWHNNFGAHNSIAQQQQQLYAGKHLLADSAEANEIAAKVTRNADDRLHMSGYFGSSSSSSTSTSRSRFKRKNFIKASGATNTIKSTPLPLVTVATLKNSADLQTTATTTTTTTDNVMRTYLNFPSDDYQQLIDLHDFTYLINQRGCSRDIQALILVHSAPANDEKRRLIRDTWANTDLLPHINGVMPFRIIFLLGTVASEAQQLDIERENFENGDIVQGSFVDSYRNMTYKHVMAFKWFLYNCAHAQILFKVDDDVHVNTPQLLIYLQRAMRDEDIKNGAGKLAAAAAAAQTVNATTFIKYTAGESENSNAFENNNLEESSSSRFSSSNDASDLNANAPIVNMHTNTTKTTSTPFNAAHMLFRHPHNLLFCKTTINAQVKRSFRSKWRVTIHEHSGKYYPPYCPGFAIIYSPDVVLRLYNAAQVSKYFWIDDVHITGTLAQNLNINITNAQRYILYEDDCDNLLNDVVNSEDKEFLYAWHLIQPEQTQKLWELYLEKAKRHLSTLKLLHSAKKTSYESTEFNKFKSYR